MRFGLHLIVMLCLVGLLFLSACQPASVVDATSTSSTHSTGSTPRIIQQLTGSDVGLRYPAVLLINSQEELQNSGSRRLRTVKIDFETQSVMLIALGEKPTGGYWVRVTGLVRKKGTTHLLATVNRPGPEQMVTQAVTFPFAAVITSKVDNFVPEIESVTGQTPTDN